MLAGAASRGEREGEEGRGGERRCARESGGGRTQISRGLK